MTDDDDWQPVRLPWLVAVAALVVTLGPWTVGVWWLFRELMR